MAESKRKDFLYYLIVFFEVIALIALAAILIFVCIPLLVKIVPITEEPQVLQKDLFPAKALNVSQLYENINFYSGGNVKVQGTVKLAPIVCQSAECSKDDPCCGCPEKRDLILADQSKTFVSEKKEVKLVEEHEDIPICERTTGSCEYQCQDWQPSNRYLVEGVFLVEKPPSGATVTRGYLSAHLLVSSKEELGKASIDPRKLLDEAVEFIKQASRELQQVRLH